MYIALRKMKSVISTLFLLTVFCVSAQAQDLTYFLTAFVEPDLRQGAAISSLFPVNSRITVENPQNQEKVVLTTQQPANAATSTGSDSSRLWLSSLSAQQIGISNGQDVIVSFNNPGDFNAPYSEPDRISRFGARSISELSDLMAPALPAGASMTPVTWHSTAFMQVRLQSGQTISIPLPGDQNYATDPARAPSSQPETNSGQIGTVTTLRAPQAATDIQTNMPVYNPLPPEMTERPSFSLPDREQNTAPPVLTPAPFSPQLPQPGSSYIQVGAFREYAFAQRFLANNHLPYPIMLNHTVKNGQNIFKVLVGPFPNTQVPEILDQLNYYNIPNAFQYLTRQSPLRAAGSRATPVVTNTPSPDQGRRVFIQIGSFSLESNAYRVAGRFNLDYPVFVRNTPGSTDPGMKSRVLVGPIDSRQAEQVLRALVLAGYRDAFIID